MKYIKTLHEGDTVRDIYLCKVKRSAETRNGKPYDLSLIHISVNQISASK